MPHSTFFSTPPPIPERGPPSLDTSSPHHSSAVEYPASLKASPSSPSKPSYAFTAVGRKRFGVGPPRGHSRSKSASATMSFPPTSVPTIAPPSPTSRLRGKEYSPPLQSRASSLPLVIPENKLQPSLMMTPPTPTTPPFPHRGGLFLTGVPRSASPTRIYASSLSPASTRSGYYPGSSYSPRTPSPPSYLVNEGVFPASASSSSPSTPTSLRSRSPSISSLETIPDTPDAEQAAVEQELKEAMDRKAARLENEDEEDNGGSRRRRSVDFDRVGMRWGAADKRKRWSVCGGEKRGDLDLETIWEEALSTAEANHVNVARQESSEEEEDEDEDEESEDEVDEDEGHQSSDSGSDRGVFQEEI